MSLTVGWYAPAPGAKSGVADYAAVLERELAKRFSLRRFASGSVNVYQLGNNQLHAGIYAEALAKPGVVVIHDAVLQHFFLGSLDQAAYVEEFVYNYGEWNRGLAQSLWDRRAQSGADAEYFRYPMLRRVCERARAVIVHNPAAAAIVRAHAPDAVVVEIPHFFEPPAAMPSAQEVLAWRESHGVGWNACLFGVFGFLRESKRIPSVLRAWQSVPGSVLLLQGEFAPGAAAISAPGVIRVGYVPDREFWLLASAVDVCVNLRWPAAGETSGIAMRLMGIGKPCIVTAGAEVSRFPAGACFAVDAGPAEGEMLTAAMLWLAESAVRRREMGRIAGEWLRTEHSLSRVVDAYAGVIEGVR